MAEQTQKHAASKTANRRLAVGSPRLGLLAGGAMGVLGFALAVFFGLAAGNEMSEIIERALLTSVALAVVGAVAGAIAGRVIRELAVRLAAEQAEAAEAAARAREAARAAQQAQEEREQGQAGDGTGEEQPAEAI